MNVLFGYGSLISPFSLAGRLNNYSVIDEIYENDKRLFDETNRKSAIEEWEKLQQSENTTAHLVKLPGYKRYYSIKHRGGGMLEAYKKQNSMINGMMYTNVPDELYEDVNSSEGGYIANTVPVSQFEVYEGQSLLSQAESASVTVFTPKSSTPRTDLTRHPVYHDGILKSFVYLLDNNFAEKSVLWEFIEEFLRETYEYDNTKDAWKSVFEKTNGVDISRIEKAIAMSDRIY